MRSWCIELSFSLETIRQVLIIARIIIRQMLGCFFLLFVPTVVRVVVAG